MTVSREMLLLFDVSGFLRDQNGLIVAFSVIVTCYAFILSRRSPSGALAVSGLLIISYTALFFWLSVAALNYTVAPYNVEATFTFP